MIKLWDLYHSSGICCDTDVHKQHQKQSRTSLKGYTVDSKAHGFQPNKVYRIRRAMLVGYLPNVPQRHGST